MKAAKRTDPRNVSHGNPKDPTQLEIAFTGAGKHLPKVSPFKQAASNDGWRDLDAFYRRRLLISVGASLLLNLFFLWMVFASHFTETLWFRPPPKPKAAAEPPQLVLVEQKPKPSQPRPKTFLETDANQAVKDAPKDARFYSEQNTLATQTTPSEVKSSDIPKAEGHNTKTMATETVFAVRPAPQPPPSPAAKPEAQKTPPVQNPPSTPSQPPAPKPADLPKQGDFALLKTTPSTKPLPQEKAKPGPPPEKPQQPSSAPPSVRPAPPAPTSAPSPSPNREVVASMSKLDGGVNRTGKALAFNSAESPFAAYDKKIIGKIGAYWQYLVQNKFYGETVGEVEVTFKLMSDGKIAELRVIRNTANPVLAGWCLQAIEDSTPFAPFPDSMKAVVGDHREGSITFAF